MPKSLFICLTGAVLLAGAAGSIAANDTETDAKSRIVIAGTLAPEDAAVAPSPDQGWQMVWSDEFDGKEIDRTKWGFDIDCWGGGNDERQCYTDRKSNAAIVDGRLVITARRNTTTGPAYPPHMRTSAEAAKAKNTKPYTSARLTTKTRHSWKYGWIEVRARLPQGQGTWPAIWMLPEANAYGPWATSGEIDILEAVNMGVPCAACPGGKENTILGTLHFGGVWPKNAFHTEEVALPGDLDGFHTFSIIWREGEMIWLVDGRQYARKTSDIWHTTTTDAPNAPFDQSFHLILNLAIGGGLAESRGVGGVSGKNFPKRFEIDWVRIWQCADDPATGKACPMQGGTS